MARRTCETDRYVLTIVINLDRPQEGLLQVSQQPLVDIQEWIGLPTP